MKLVTKEIKKSMPEIGKGDNIAMVKYFTPDSNWTWYGIEYDGEDTMFGIVNGLTVEMGYFSITELESVRGPLGLPIERDLYFSPTSASRILSELRSSEMRQA